MSSATDVPARKDRTWLYVALGFTTLWAFYLGFFVPANRPGDAPRLGDPPPAAPVDYDWKLLDLDGNPVSFSRFQGKAVFLNIWATWCAPCVGEMPSIAKLAADPRLKAVSFVCVSTDTEAAAVKRFLDDRGKDWKMTVLRASSLPPSFTTDGIPATFLIAPDGKVTASEIGSANWDDPGVVALLQQLASGSGAGPAPTP